MSGVLYLSEGEWDLVRHGWEELSFQDQQSLSMEVANKLDLTVFQMTEDVMLNHHKNLQKRILNQECEERVVAGYKANNGHTYGTKKHDQINMLSLELELRDEDSDKTIEWKTEDKGYVKHTRTELIGIFKEIAHNKRNIIRRCGEIKEKIDNAKTHEEIVELSKEDI